MSSSQKLIKWIHRKVEGYSRPEKHYEPIQHNYKFHTTVGYKSYSSSIDYKLGDTGQGHKTRCKNFTV